MDNINKSGADAFETFQVGKRTYRRVKPENVSTKVARRSQYQAPSAGTSLAFSALIVAMLLVNPSCILASENNEEPDTCAVKFEAQPEPSESAIKQTSSGFSFDLPVDPKYYTVIIGAKGATVTKIRQLTGCSISVPAKDSKSTAIALSGPTRDAVEDAIKRILQIVNSSSSSAENARPKRQEFDFFVSLPLLDAAFAKSLHHFFADVKGLVKQGFLNLEEKSFMSPSSLHFTLCMLHLHSPSNIQRAVELLQELSPQITELANNKPLDIDWGHVTTFKDADISNAAIIFAEPGPNLRPTLEEIGNLIRTKFIEAGLVNDELEESRGLTLHATLLNARPRKINASHLANLPSAALAPLTVNEIHLSQRFSFDPNGYYHCAHKIQIEQSPKAL